MKSSNVATIRIAPWAALAGLLLASCTVGAPLAGAQRLLSFVSADRQQPSTDTPSTTGLPVITPEVNADLMVAHQRYGDAIAAYKKLTPQTAEIDNKIGMAYQRLSMYADARYYYTRAIKTDRKFAAPYNNLGTIEYHDRNNKHAERLYHRSIKINPSIAPFWSNLGSVYLAEKKYHDGAEAYQRAFVLDPSIFDDIAINGIHEFSSNEDMAKMYICFAGIYAQAGLKAEAVDYLRKALLEGFSDKKALHQDQEFAGLRGDPAFEKLLASQHRQ